MIYTNNNKQFAIFKIGYNKTSSGSYSSYYKIIVIKDYKFYDYVINAPYTEGQSIEHYLYEAGYQELYITMPYSKLSKNDIKDWQTSTRKIMHESEVLEDLKIKLN